MSRLHSQDLDETVDPVVAAQQTIVFVDPRKEPEGAPSVSYEEMIRTVHEIEGMDRSVDYLRDKAHRYVGWLQGVAEGAYGVPSETLRDINRGVTEPRYPGYEADRVGWYSRPLEDFEPREARFPFGFTDRERLYVMSPAHDPLETEETTIEIHAMAIPVGELAEHMPPSLGAILSRAAGGRAIEEAELGELLHRALGGKPEGLSGLDDPLEAARNLARGEIRGSVRGAMQGAPDDLHPHVDAFIEDILADREPNMARLQAAVHGSSDPRGAMAAIRRVQDACVTGMIRARAERQASAALTGGPDDDAVTALAGLGREPTLDDVLDIAMQQAQRKSGMPAEVAQRIRDKVGGPDSPVRPILEGLMARARGNEHKPFLGGAFSAR